MSWQYLLAWLLPLFAGSGLVLAIGGGRRMPGNLCAMLGTGFLLGVFVAGILCSLIARENVQGAFADVAPWLAAIGILAWVAALGLRGKPWPEASFNKSGLGWRMVWCLLLAMIGLRIHSLASEVLLRPTFPWDAWAAWAVKPKAWFLLGHYAGYEPMQQWLANPGTTLRTSAIWDYPELLAWVQVWFASAVGGWNEPLINAVWLGVLVAIGLGSYGNWRVLGVAPLWAMILAYGLLSLPLIDAHVALAGYADLWLAATFGLAVLSWLRWLRWKEHGQLLLAVALAFCMPFIKLEGAVWLLIASVLAGLSLLPRRWRWMTVGAIVLMLGASLLFGGLVLPVFGLGWVHMSWGSVVVPALGKMDLQWYPVGVEMLSGLFTLPNRHLLWYLLPLVLVLRWRGFLVDQTARWLGILLLCCATFLFILFFFTEASAWAENYTSSNRLIMHLVPAVFTLLALLLRGVSVSGSDRAPESEAPNAPA